MSHPTKSLQIVAILRDWSKGEYQRELADAEKKGFRTTRYPSEQVAVLDVPIIPEEEVLAYVLEQAQAHMTGRATPDADLPVCTEEERWARKSMWAIVKNGNKKATKLADTEQEAKLLLTQYGNGYIIESRPGQSTRCASYCSVASKCLVAKRNGWYKP